MIMMMIEVVRASKNVPTNRVDGFMLMIFQLDASHIVMVRLRCTVRQWEVECGRSGIMCSQCVDASTTESKQKLPNRIVMSCLDFITNTSDDGC